jgi:predicted porin
MKKTLVAASIAALVAAPAAFAEVSIYGKAHLAMEFHDNDDDQIDSRASRFGIKASEDLGDGMSAFVKYEFGADTIDGDNGLTARDAYMGLKGDFGTLTVGRMSAPTKAVLYGTGNVQLADANQGWDFANNFASKGTRVDNAVAYGTKVGGVNLTLATVGDDAGDNFANQAIGLSTDVGSVHVGFAHINDDGDENLTIAGAKMSMDALTLGVVYEDFEDTSDTLGASASYKMGSNVASVSVSSREYDNGNDLDVTTFGLEHKFSKKTSAYLSYASVDDGADEDSVTSVGMIMNF